MRSVTVLSTRPELGALTPLMVVVWSRVMNTRAVSGRRPVSGPSSGGLHQAAHSTHQIMPLHLLEDTPLPT